MNRFWMLVHEVAGGKWRPLRVRLQLAFVTGLLVLPGCLWFVPDWFSERLWYWACSLHSIPIDAPSAMGGTTRARVEPSAQPTGLRVWVDIMLSGVYSPAMNSPLAYVTRPAASGTELPVPPLLNELAEKGYVALRVPDLGAQASRVISPVITLNYFSPPDAPTRTSVPITVTRWISQEAAVTARFGTDGRSHWEVWRVPPGDRLPIPNTTFELRREWPAPLAVEFAMDFGTGSNASDAFGLPAAYALYNGYNFIGPVETIIAGEEWPYTPNQPMVAFGGRCGLAGLTGPTVAPIISPTLPFSHVLCLENYDTVSRTYDITASSSQGWSYQYYYRTPTQLQTLPAGGDVPGGNASYQQSYLAPRQLQPVPGLPFSVTAGPATSDFPWAGLVNIIAVYTPTVGLDDTVRETLMVTATSVISPTVRATGTGLALGQNYRLDETGGFRMYLPVILRND